MSALLALESNLAFDEPFDLVVGVSPFPNDRTADLLEAGGITVLRQPSPVGLSDLWNRLFRHFMARPSYHHIIFSNNDVLVPPGVVTDLTWLLDK